jgi:hypothetical protein
LQQTWEFGGEGCGAMIGALNCHESKTKKAPTSRGGMGMGVGAVLFLWGEELRHNKKVFGLTQLILW